MKPSAKPFTACAQDKLSEEKAIQFVKKTFASMLSENLSLHMVTAPLAVLDGTGINDDLNGTERPVRFPVRGLNHHPAVVVHSLAKWKRVRLMELGIEAGQGIITDMHALRPDEELGPMHSVYVDQWDWEQRITPEEYTISFLKRTVSKIYGALKTTENLVCMEYPDIKPVLPDKIRFIHSEDLLSMFPNLSPGEREREAARRFGAYFLIGIGAELSNGEPHDGRAPDYDDWSTPGDEGRHGLNGDIIVWNPMLESAFEISSMGIRVSPEALLRQLEIKRCPERKNLLYHQMLLGNKLPLSIGGGIGQSRVCMFMLRKTHISQVQVSIWPPSTLQKMKESGIEPL
jgi:aspartate--ammonia ligase